MTDLLKKALRTTLIQVRRQLSLDYQITSSARICQKILQMPLFNKSIHIAIYAPIKGEVRIDTLQQVPNKQFYYPVMDASHLIFLPVTADTQFKPNAHGILEPLVDKTLQIAVQALDLMITPLVAFDNFGTRLGFGKGYYDKALAQEKPKHLMGVAYDFQRQTWIERESWDIPLNSVMTPTRWIVF